MPYRSSKDRPSVEAETEGPVADMVRQFADRYAFVRELVQNGIDAGATRLEVCARRTAEGEAIFSVDDDGEGMTREIIEGPLLTLFNSAKDEDDSKIGKYGVGFVSVFAIEPDEVVVESRCEGHSWVLRLRPDHSYELATGERRPDGDGGTVVSLHRAMGTDAFEAHMQQVSTALRRWCRHARVPIHWVVRRDDQGGRGWRERIDQPLAVVSPLQVMAELDGATLVVGPSSGSEYLDETSEAPENVASFAGFYNHGLTLYETAEAPRKALHGVRFKVDCPRLEHTLSRDNVRHDAAYARLLDQLEDLVEGELRRKLVAALGRAAATAAEGRRSAGGVVVGAAQYTALLAAACSPAMNVAVRDIAVPLTNKVGGRSVCAVDELGDRFPLYAPKASKLTAALAREHRPVMRAVRDAVPTLVGSRLGHSMTSAEVAFGLVEPIERSRLKASDRKLCKHTLRALRAAGADVRTPMLVKTQGAAAKRAGVGVPGLKGSGAKLVSAAGAGWHRRLSRCEPLALVASHAAVKAARRFAREDAAVAGELLARYLLVEELGELSKSASDDLLAASAERVGGAS